MMLLAIEMSSAQASLAICRHTQPVREWAWDTSRARGDRLFANLAALLDEEGLRSADIDAYAVGRGPGNYTGLRVALSAARALALPGGKPVYAWSSGEALAWQTAHEEQASHVAVVGDARRGRLWLAVFALGNADFRALTAWTLVAPEAVAAYLPERCLVVSPEWARVQTALEPLAGPSVACVKENRYPTARVLGLLAMERIRRQMPSDPLAPLYLHPAV